MIHDRDQAHVEIASVNPVTLQIQAENIPEGTCVKVRVVAASGPTDTFTSTPLKPGKSGNFEAVADVTFGPGFSVVQMRADFSEDGGGGCALLPRQLRGLKTLNGKRITRVQLASTMGGGSRLIYVTEKGRKIPVDVR